MKKIIVSITMIFLSLTGGDLNAFQYNHRNVPIGERAAMMGGAYTALSNDISGAYYNPAGLAFITQTSISMNANMYSYQEYIYRDDPSSPQIPLRKLELVPTTFGINFNVTDRFSTAVSAFVIDKTKFSGSNIRGNEVANIDIDTETTLLGPSFSYRLTDGLALGVSAFFQYYRGKISIFGDDGTGYITEQKSQVTSGGLDMIFGGKYLVMPKLHLGLQYGMETININGSNTYYRSESTNPPPVSGSTDEYDYRLPGRATLGVAYEEKKKFTLALDVIYYFPMKYSAHHYITRPELDSTEYREERHYDISLGCEWYLNSAFALRLGIFSNTSGAGDNKLGEGNDVNRYGGSIGIGYVNGELSSGFGISGMYGEGGSWDRLFSLSLIVGATVRFGS